MNHALLLAGLLLPWLLGYSWLLPWRKALGTGTAGLLGYGFFLGAALLYLILLGWHSLLGSISFWPLAGTLAVLAGVGLAAGRWLRTPDSQHHPAPATTDGRMDWLAAGLLGLVALHFAFVAMELYYRPVYPWDAWQTWMYKAKAWFYAGGPVSLDAPADWISNSGGSHYNVQANHYPGLVPAMSYWAAVSLGQWSETRVNWPTLLCGLALCLALWEQVKMTTGSARLGAAACLLFVSIPLVGTHLSLAGYADIWLAGFSGLGLVALLRGLLQRHHGQCVLGLLFLATGLLAKSDAAVWLASGVALLLLVRHTRLSLLLAGLGVLGLLVLAMAGVEYIALPYLGPLGIHDNHLALGPLGSWPLRPHNVLPDYFEHLFLLNSWNLLWYLLLALVVLLLASPQLRALRAPAGWFLLLMVASQALLFGLTAAGAWATDGTALNRLLLHITPTLVFLLAVAAGQWTRAQGTPIPGSLRQFLIASIAATLLVGAGASLWLMNQATDGKSQAKAFTAGDLRAVEGNARVAGDKLLVTHYADGAAIITSGRTLLDADQLELAQLKTHPENHKARELFWRQASAPHVIQTQVVEAGETWIDLRRQSGWTGQLSEVGVIFYEDDDHKTGVSALHLHPATALNLAQLAFSQWQQGESWSQRSINALRLGPNDQLLPLTALLGCWLLVGLLVLALSSRGRLPPVTVTALVLAAWWVLDLRWLYNSFEQAAATRKHYASTETPDALDLWGNDMTIQLAQRVVEHLGDEPRRVAIGALANDMRFQLLRTKYALLPHAGYVHEGELSALPSRDVDAVLMVYPLYEEARIPLPDKLPGRVGWMWPIMQSPGGILYGIPMAGEPGRIDSYTGSD